ncbi:GNAT family N-acetyltransferase [Streptomyces sp. NPDC006464]|uniref:GNAT family N-acetyltransferase n=1 Tax=Streptomyces sp. NPDC006464 TaxID=3154305 RepID=UPI0033B5FFFD
MNAYCTVRPVTPDDPRVPALLAAYHLRTEAEKGVPVASAAELPPAYRAEALDPAAAFAADTVLLAVDAADTAAGLVVLTAPHQDGVPEIKRLWVAPEARGRGVAAALMDGAVDHATRAGAPAVRLSVWLWRGRAIALYRGLGFETVRPWDDRPGLLCLEKRLRTPAGPGAPARIERLPAARIREHAADGLAALLVDAVDGGASLGFLAPLDPAEAVGWWLAVAEETERGARTVWTAHGPGDVVLGAVTLVRGDKANGRHRGEIARLIVHRAARGQGLGGRLLAAAEEHAAGEGLTLLVLDTQTDSPAERLYRRAGWTAAGTIPDFAADPAGTLRPTTLYYKQLGTLPQDARIM